VPSVPFTSDAADEHRALFAELRELDVPAGETQHFRCKLAPGRCVVEGRSPALSGLCTGFRERRW
jgi:hypothetical protein